MKLLHEHLTERRRAGRGTAFQTHRCVTTSWTRAGDSWRSDRGEGEKRVAFSDRALIAHEHDASVAFRLDGVGAGATQHVNHSENASFAHVGAETDLGNKQAVMRRGMVYLQVSLLRVDRCACFLTVEPERWSGDATGPTQQMGQAAIQRVHIARHDPAGTATFDVDGGNVSRMRRTERTTRQIRSGP